ncbi:hypothetical protein KFU94_15585 [Chloroflexi bacterium TSY]|nr:hypothetical protein [Chloroflexi bacterium TSY]
MLQLDDFDTAANQIAEWGHNDWSFVYAESASDDLTAWLANVAQADLGDNAFVMRNTEPMIKRLDIARRVWKAAGVDVSGDNVADRVWKAAGVDVSGDNVADLINPGFIARAAAQPSLQATGNPINDTFSISAKLDLSGVDTNDAATLAVLPCRRFAFVPESTELTLESRRILDDCVVPTLAQSVGLFLRVNGSAAWPGPKGTYTEKEILDFAEARAQSVVDYLVSQNIDSTRFIVEATLPPPEHRESEDPEIQAQDRFVEMTLITVGR